MSDCVVADYLYVFVLYHSLKCFPDLHIFDLLWQLPLFLSLLEDYLQRFCILLLFAFQVKLMCSYCKKHSESEVPDPYYGGPQGFEKVSIENTAQ